MVEINFNYEGINTIIQCDENEKLKEIIERFLVKRENNNKNNLIYLYNGTKINEELKFKE